MSYDKKNSIFPSAISGIQPDECKYQKSTALRRRRPVARRRQAEARRQKQFFCEITNVMEEVYRNLFDRVSDRGLVQGPQNSNQIDLEEQTPEVRAAFKDLSESALNLGPEMDAWQAIKALRAAYWAGVHLSGYDLYKTSAVIPRAEADKECHARASILKSAMSGLSGPCRRYYAVHAVALLWGRYYHVAAAHGWKTLAVLLHSIRFVSFARTADPPRWESLMAFIGENITSLQLVGSFYCRGWDDAMKEALPEGVKMLTDDEEKSYNGGYYNWRVPSDKNARIFEGTGPETPNWQDRFSQDQKVVQNALGVEAHCNSCAQSWTECKCSLEDLDRDPARVELIGTENMGTGVRALQSFKKGQLLVEVVGDLIDHESDDNIYNSNSSAPPAYIILDRYNSLWTRFVNHSCEANCSIDNIERRGKRLLIYTARRDIKLFEEITINYGRDYFINNGLECLCNSEEHIV